MCSHKNLGISPRSPDLFPWATAADSAASVPADSGTGTPVNAPVATADMMSLRKVDIERYFRRLALDDADLALHPAARIWRFLQHLEHNVEAEALLHDLYDLMRHNQAPGQRQRIKSALDGIQQFWRLVR